MTKKTSGLVKKLRNVLVGTAMTVASILPSFGQDYSKLPLMDLYNAPNIVQGESRPANEFHGSGGERTESDLMKIYEGNNNLIYDLNGDNAVTVKDAQILAEYLQGQRTYLPGDWDAINKIPHSTVNPETGNSLKYDLKVDWLEKMIPLYQIENFSVPAECEIYSKNYFFNMRGIENFEKYEGIDNNNDGISEGYDQYNQTVENGFVNIPAYTFSVTKKNGEAHEWPGVFVGEKDPTKEDNSQELTNYYIFDYGNNGERVIPGDSGIDPNKPVTVNGTAYVKETDEFLSGQLVTWDLNDGVATVSSYSPFIQKENDKDLYVNASWGDGTKSATINITNDFDLDNYLSGRNLYTETNSKDYKDSIEKNKWYSDTTYLNQVEFDVNLNGSAKMNVGRNTVLSDTATMKLNVRDLEDAYFTFVPGDTVVEGMNASISPDALGYARGDDNSGVYSVTYTDNYVNNSSQRKEIERTWEVKDFKGQGTSKVQYIVQEGGNATSANSLENGDFGVYPTRVRNNLNLENRLGHSERVAWDLYSVDGKLVKEDSYNMYSGDRDQINMNGLSPGVYLLNVQAGEKSRTYKVVKE